MLQLYVSVCARAKKIGQAIGEPVAKCTERLRLLAEGDLHTPAPVIRTQDETQILAEATAALSGNLQKVIGDADYLLGEMSQGNFALTTGCAEAYVGDFQGLLESIRKLNHKLSETLNEIKTAVGQVSLGANQMADAAQGLAEGATDQAGSVEELQATITNVTEIVEKNAKALGGSLPEGYGLPAAGEGQRRGNEGSDGCHAADQRYFQADQRYYR